MKLIEGTLVNVTVGSGPKRMNNSETKQINTKNILFICAGAFEDLLPIIERSLNSQYAGFAALNSGKDISSSKYDDIMKHCEHEHLIKYGLIPELIGRLPTMIKLNELTIKDFLGILINTKNAIMKQYAKLLSIKDNAKLEWTDNALEIIASYAKTKNVGARGLRQLLDDMLSETMFDLPDNNKESLITVLIDEDVASRKSPPKVTFSTIS